MIKSVFIFCFTFVSIFLYSDQKHVFNVPELLNGEAISSSKNCYSCVQEIGCGGFGVVYEVVDSNNQKYALKLYRDFSNKEGLRTFEISQQLHHPNIIKAIDHSDSNNSNASKDFVVLEYVEGKTLKLIPDNSISLIEMQVLMSELIEALCYALSQGYIHCDMNEENIMIDKGFHLRIIDIDSFVDGVEKKPLIFDATLVKTCLYVINKSNLSRKEKNDLRIKVQQVSWDYADDILDGIDAPLFHYYERLKLLF